MAFIYILSAHAVSFNSFCSLSARMRSLNFRLIYNNSSTRISHFLSVSGGRACHQVSMSCVFPVSWSTPSKHKTLSWCPERRGNLIPDLWQPYKKVKELIHNIAAKHSRIKQSIKHFLFSINSETWQHINDEFGIGGRPGSRRWGDFVFYCLQPKFSPGWTFTSCRYNNLHSNIFSLNFTLLTFCILIHV